MNRYPDFIRHDRSPDWERPTLREMPGVAFGPLERRQLPCERWWGVVETALAITGGILLVAFLIAGIVW